MGRETNMTDNLEKTKVEIALIKIYIPKQNTKLDINIFEKFNG